MRTCYTCKESKPLSNFYKGRCWKDGYDIYCKDCAKKRRLYNKHNPKGNRNKSRLITDTQFWCPKCKVSKTRDEFYIDNGKRKSRAGLSVYCKVCDNGRHKTIYQREKNRHNYQMLIKEQPEKLRAERVRKLGVWRKLKDTPKWRLNKSKAQHIRRDRVRNSEITLTSEDILFLIDFQENKCACCKKDFSESLKYELDHINPVSKGGGLTLDNIQLLCKSCNCSKGDKMINYRNEISFIKGGLNG